MPGALHWAAAFAFADVAAGTPVTPVSKVIALLDDLKTKVTNEGTAEAASYDAFACFCKTTTTTKSQSITTNRDTIQTKSSEVELKTALKGQKADELSKLQRDHAQYVTDQADLRAVHAKEESTFLVQQADLSKALSSITSAITAMQNSKPASGPSFLAVRDQVQQSIALAEVMNLIPEPKKKALHAFLQMSGKVDPSDPSYLYHSEGIIGTLTTLHTDFGGQKTDLETEWGKTQQTFGSADGALTGKISTATSGINQLKDVTIPGLVGDIATARSDLVNTDAELKDDQVYLKDLTSLCETRAKDWDQRSALRAKELTALEQALNVLRTDVDTRDQNVNKRALLLKLAPAKLAKVAVHGVPPALLQESMQGAAGTVSKEAKAQEAISALLQQEGTRLHSTLLSAAAARVQGNPFGQVKTLIQKLIERLLAESTAEATKKGFCDHSLADAGQDRDFRLEETQDLNQELNSLQLKQDELESEIAELEGDLVTLRTDLNTTEVQRDADRIANHNTVTEAKAGLKAVQEAITILKVFYKQAAKATVLLQASPVHEDLATQNTGAGFEGAYKGQQTGSRAIFGLLEVIETDFDRTARMTAEAEKEAEAQFVLFDRNSRADISAKDQKRELDEEDLQTTKDSFATKMQDLRTAQGLLDTALQAIEALKPTCIDTGMSFDERTQKRQDELVALEQALCILDVDGVETRCGGGGGGGPPPPGGQTLS